MTPAERYFSQLAPSGRRPALHCFNVAAKRFGNDWRAWVPTAEQVEQLRADMIESKTNVRTARLTIAAIRGVCRYAKRAGVITAAQLWEVCEVPDIKGSRGLAGRMLSNSEVKAILDSLPNSFIGSRDGAILALCLFCGLRRSEAASVDLGDITGQVLTVIGKGNKERRIPINRTARELFNRYLEHRGRSPGPLLLTQNKARRINPELIARRCQYMQQAAGLDHFSPHDLRRTFISYLLSAGADIATVQRLAGHASPSDTTRYDRRPETEAAAAVELLIFTQQKREQMQV